MQKLWIAKSNKTEANNTTLYTTCTCGKRLYMYIVNHNIGFDIGEGLYTVDSNVVQSSLLAKKSVLMKN